MQRLDSCVYRGDMTSGDYKRVSVWIGDPLPRGAPTRQEATGTIMLVRECPERPGGGDH